VRVAFDEGIIKTALLLLTVTPQRLAFSKGTTL